MLYKVVLTFDSVYEILECINHSNGSYWAEFPCGAVHHDIQGSYNFWFCVWNPGEEPFKWKLLSCIFITLYKTVVSFDFVYEILECNHSNESYWAVFSCDAVYYALQDSSNFWFCVWNPKV